MQFTSAEIASWIGMYLWPLFRVMALVAMAPVFGAQSVPVRIRVGFSVALTLVIAPVLPPVPVVDPLSSAGLMIVIQQVLIGLAMGFSLKLVFGAFVLAGQLIGQSMGLGFASMVDPLNGVQVPVVSQFYQVLVTLIFLALNGHLVLLEVLADSFRTLPVGPNGLAMSGVWDLVIWGGQMFSGAVLISLPAVTALLVANIAFGVMTRASPQLNIFAIGFPITLLLGIVVMLVTLPVISPQLNNLMSDVFALIQKMVAGGT
ncbi:MAG: flagellar biosynthetic protein FliR [Gammaproteobacteria bacterium]|jgi:flagellar biosynthetic protein FliR|nr:flagellar biosynthetic protein FliR [Gammaproteobacteria bacterium]